MTSGFGQSKHSIDLLYGLEYSDIRHNYQNVHPDFLQDVKGRNALTHGLVNYRFGLNYNVKIIDKFYLKSGLRFFRTGYSSGKSDVVWAVPDPTQNQIQEVEYISKYYYLELPIIGRYQFVEKRLTPFIEIGLAPSYYIGSRGKKITDLYTVENKIGVDRSFNKLQLVGVISAGANFAMSEKLQLFAQPICRIHINSISTDNKWFLHSDSLSLNSSDSFNNFGIELGVRRLL